jgi:hypothetical protein
MRIQNGKAIRSSAVCKAWDETVSLKGAILRSQQVRSQ